MKVDFTGMTRAEAMAKTDSALSEMIAQQLSMLWLQIEADCAATAGDAPPGCDTKNWTRMTPQEVVARQAAIYAAWKQAELASLGRFLDEGRA
jgi:hypothetical protein